MWYPDERRKCLFFTSFCALSDMDKIEAVVSGCKATVECIDVTFFKLEYKKIWKVTTIYITFENYQ